MLTPLLRILTILLMPVSILIISTGYGLYTSLLGLALCIATSNTSVVGAFFLIFCSPVLGYIAAELGFAGWGGDIVVILALLLLMFRYPLDHIIVKCMGGFLVLIWCTYVLIFFFLTGPQTAYSTQLIILFVKTSFLSFFAFFFIFRDRRVDWEQLGIMGIYSAIIYMTFAGLLDRSILPQGILDFGKIRMAVAGKASINPHQLAFTAVLGFMFVFAKGIQKRKNINELFSLIISLLTSVIIVSWSGARQGIFFLIFGILLLILLCPQSRTRQRIKFSLTFVILFFLIIIIGSFRGFSGYQVLMDKESTVYKKLNRASNYESAIMLFMQKPFLGHGLGGYYVPGTTKPGERSYAHNFLLDLLSQTGLIGTIAFLFPFIFFDKFKKRMKLLFVTINGHSALPVFSVFFLHSLISGSFSSIGSSIALIVVLPLYSNSNTYSSE